MWPNSKFPADLVKFTKEIVNVKFHFEQCYDQNLEYNLPKFTMVYQVQRLQFSVWVNCLSVKML